MIPATPSPDASSLAAAIQWIAELLQGSIATAAATLAVAILGYQMMAGRLSLQAALRLTLGCFILFGSSAIARGLMGGHGENEVSARSTNFNQLPPAAPETPIIPPSRPPAQNGGNPFDPYANAPPQ